MTKKKIVLVSIFILVILSIGIYHLLGDKHPLVAVVMSFLVLTKLKIASLLALIWAKLYLFLSASKGKIFLFVKNLTFVKGSSLAIKRFIIDNVISKWISKNFTVHISEPIKEWINYFKKLNFKTKIKKSLLLIIPTSIIGAIMYFGGMLQSFALYAQLKVLVIGFFKFLWLAASKIIFGAINLISGTWLAPIVEILALSWLLSWIERIPLIGPLISKFFSNIGDTLGLVFSKISAIFYKYIGRHFSLNLTKIGIKVGDYLNDKINYTKVKNEIEIFDNFQKKYLLKDIQKYFNGPYKREYKKDFYRNVNKHTNDHVDIKAYIEMDSSINYIKDFFILEGLASCNETGSKHKRINKNSFWAMNLNDIAVVLFSENDKIKPIYLPQNALKLVQPKEEINFKDLYIVDINQKKYSNIVTLYKEDSKKEKFVNSIHKTSSDEFMLI